MTSIFKLIASLANVPVHQQNRRPLLLNFMTNMKNFLLLTLMSILLIGCGYEEALKYTTAGVGLQHGTVSLDVPDVLPQVSNFNCMGMTIPGTNRAQVTFDFEPTEDGTVWNGKGSPVIVYGGGLVEMPEIKEPFETEVPFSCDGVGDVSGFEIEAGKEAFFADWLIELETTKLTAQADGSRIDSGNVRIMGVANVATTKTAQFGGGDVQKYTEVKCITGQAIPDSNLASITFSARTPDGKKIIGGGLALFPDTAPDQFTCDVLGDVALISETVVDPESGYQLQTLNLQNVNVLSQQGETKFENVPVMLLDYDWIAE